MILIWLIKTREKKKGDDSDGYKAVFPQFLNHASMLVQHNHISSVMVMFWAVDSIYIL